MQKHFGNVVWSIVSKIFVGLVAMFFILPMVAHAIDIEINDDNIIGGDDLIIGGDMLTQCPNCHKCVSFSSTGCLRCEYDSNYCEVVSLYCPNMCDYFKSLYNYVTVNNRCVSGGVSSSSYNALTQRVCSDSHSGEYQECYDCINQNRVMYFNAICEGYNAGADSLIVGDGLRKAIILAGIDDCNAFEGGFDVEELAAIVPSEQWYPGQYCYTDTDEYIMYRCDCERDAAVTQAVSGIAECLEVYGNTNEIRSNCYLGTKQEVVYSLTNAAGEVPYCGETSDVLSSGGVDYVCADPSDSMQTPEILCGCKSGVWSTWGTNGVSNGAIRSRSQYTCGDIDWSTRCQDTEHNLSGDAIEDSAQYNCMANGAEYQCSCASNSYEISKMESWGESCDCAPCPCVTDKDGIRRCGTTSGAGLQIESAYGYFLGSSKTDCGLSRGTFADGVGTFVYDDYCRWQN